MTDPQTLAALATAIEAEKQSLHNYLEFAWNTRDNAGKQMFVRLATDEFEHMRLLETQQAGLAQSGQWQPVTVEATILERLAPRLSDKSLRIRGSEGQNQLSALNTALDLERSAQTFYEEQSRKAQTDPARAMFARLAEMEAAHYALIQAEIDNIQQTGFWFGLREFTLESERP
jgi:rubrerythrin